VCEIVNNSSQVALKPLNRRRVNKLITRTRTLFVVDPEHWFTSKNLVN